MGAARDDDAGVLRQEQRTLEGDGQLCPYHPQEDRGGGGDGPP